MSNPHPFLRHRRTLAMGTAAAVVLVGLSAFAFVPGVRTASAPDPAPRLVAAAEPVRSNPPRMLENGAPSASPTSSSVSAPPSSPSPPRPPRPAPPTPMPCRRRSATSSINTARAARAARRAPAQGDLGRLRLHHRQAGFVVTNNHVIENSHKITVKLPDGAASTPSWSAPIP